MKTTLIILICPAMLMAAERLPFDDSWKFARFGDMPDDMHREEPGSPPRVAKASSAEPKNPAEHAVDGEQDTRWCAAGAMPSQSLTLDFGRVRQLGEAEIDWETAAPYPFKVELSTDGETWKLAADRSNAVDSTGHAKIGLMCDARFVRVMIVESTPSRWASIRELRVIDPQGNSVKPIPLESAAGVPASAPGFDDSGWRPLKLPHDWGIEGPFRMELPNETGKLPWPGIGWYRKTLELTEADRGKTLYLDFDGAMSRPKVFVNGTLAGEWRYGYGSFRVELTPHLNSGAPNTIAVRLDNPPESSRWYPGGGIYRHVWLVKANPIHIAHHGIFVRSENVSTQSAEVLVGAEITGSADGIEIVHELLDPDGKRVASHRSFSPETRLKVASPKLWSTENPYIYTLRTTLLKGSEPLDSEDTAIGIRTAAWKPDGFFLNGKRVQLRGVCNHHDLGALGAAFNVRAAERQLEILREMGCNSIRTTHNPPAPQLLELCDRMGILVIDELFDMWNLSKTPNDYGRDFDAWHEREVANFVRRDRNHPSVIAWSSGNEVYEQTHPDKYWISEKLEALFHKHDPTRKVTIGMNDLQSALKGLGETVDVVGLNYPVKDVSIPAKLRQRRPEATIYTSESASCVSTRGTYFFPVSWDKSKGFYNFQVSSYELSATPWANRPDLEFELLERNPFMAGEYVWTGFDYFGEPSPYNRDKTNANNFQNEEEKKKGLELLARLGNRAPSRSSYFGILDLCGFPKDRYYLYQSHWRPEHPMAHILPHWNWPERVGEITPVHVFTSGDEAELFLNGKSLGRRKKRPFEYRLAWEDVVYQPGALTVKTWKNGKPWVEADRSTTGAALKLLATADRQEIRADGDDLCYVTVSVSDDQGRTVPRSMNRLYFRVEGAAEIVAACNGDPTSHEPITGAKTMAAFNGLCQIVLRARKGEAGEATLHVKADDLEAGSVAIQTK